MVSEFRKINQTQWTDQCLIAPTASRGVPAIRDMRRVSLRHEIEARGLSARCNKKVMKHFSSYPSPFSFLHFTLPDGGFALTFAGIIFLCIRDFASWF